MRVFTFTWSILCLLFTVLPFIQTNAWWIRVLDFPRLQIAVGCLVALILLLCCLDGRKRSTRVLISLLAGALLYQASRILPFTPLYPPEVASQKQVALNNITILQSNVKMSNHQADKLLQLIGQYQPDLISINEPDAWWAQQLSVLDATYPYSLKKPLPNTYGMMLYSRFPLHNAEVNFLVAKDVPSFFAVVVLPSGARFDLHCVHPEPPKPGSSTYERDTELFLIGKRISRTRRPAIVVGDLNDVAWSRTTRKFKEYSHMADPRIGRGLYNTFNAHLPLLRYPLDHFFFTRHFVLHTLRKLGPVGSDHFPMYISLNLNTPP